MASFPAFEQAIISPALKNVARHWNEARGTRKMPGWDDIRPSQIAAQLPIMWAYKYDRATDAFVCRLAGEAIARIFGKNVRGVPMKDIYPPNEFQRLFELAKRIVCEPALYRSEGMVFRHVEHFGHGERVIMPLASDEVHADGILGATEYQSLRGAPTAAALEVENWFRL